MFFGHRDPLVLLFLGFDQILVSVEVVCISGFSTPFVNTHYIKTLMLAQRIDLKMHHIIGLGR